MANPLYLATIKFPLTEKPETPYIPEYQKIYLDVFNLQNTLRMIIQNFTEEAPVDGSSYVRKDGSWVIGGGGGGGGIPEAPIDGKLYGRKDASWTEVPATPASSAFNLYITGNLSGINANYRGYTMFVLLSAGSLLSLSNKWKFSMWLQATAAITVGPIKLLKTPVGKTNVLSSSDVTVGGLLTPLVTPPNSSPFRITTDNITTALDGTTDVWIAVYFPSTNAVTNDVGVIENTSTVRGNYILGNSTGATTIPVAATFPYLVSNVQQVP